MSLIDKKVYSFTSSPDGTFSILLYSQDNKSSFLVIPSNFVQNFLAAIVVVSDVKRRKLGLINLNVSHTIESTMKFYFYR